MTFLSLFNVLSRCQRILDVLFYWRFASSDPATDSKDSNANHSDVLKHVGAADGPSRDCLGNREVLEHNSTTGILANPRRQDPIRHTSPLSMSSGSLSDTLTQSCTAEIHHRPKLHLFSTLPPGGAFTIDSPRSFPSSNSNDRENRMDTLLDLTDQLSRTSEYATSCGGVSDIWKCNLKRDGIAAAVAVKSIRSHTVDEGEVKKKNRRLHRELKVWSRLGHDNIVPLYGTASGFGHFAALVCPWYENGSLSSYLESIGETLSVVDRFQLLSDVSAGLEYLHSCSIVHGDLTGSNVLISSDGRAHLSDFGLSVVVVELMATSYFTSALSGTVRWIAPERLAVPEEGTNVIPTTHSDIYSYGCIMFQVLTCKPPYFEYKRDAQVVLAISLGKKPLRPTHPPIIDNHWEFILNCWSIEDCRPSAQQVDAYIKKEKFHIA